MDKGVRTASNDIDDAEIDARTTAAPDEAARIATMPCMTCDLPIRRGRLYKIVARAGDGRATSVVHSACAEDTRDLESIR